MSAPNVSLTPPVKCSNHFHMVSKGWYKAQTGSYEKSCHQLQCPVHGISECRQRYHRFRRVFHPSWGFRTWLHHFPAKPDLDAVRSIRRIVREGFRSWDRNAKIGQFLHPLDGDWHLHIGVQSFWFFTPKLLYEYGQHVESRIVGQWDDGKYRMPRGRPRTADLGKVLTGIEGEIDDFCAWARSNSRSARLVAGQFTDQPANWLWYCLRCKGGWADNEQLPKGQGYRITSGLLNRKKKATVQQPPV
jgi:hypothetical protein